MTFNKKEYRRNYYKKNKDKILKKGKEWREANPEKAKKTIDKWRENNPNKIKIGTKKYRKENQKSIKEWRKNNPYYLKNWRLKNPNNQRPYRNLINVLSCGECKITEKESFSKYSKPISVHHRDLNHSNNKINNLQALCCSCHTKLHRKEGVF